MRELLIKTAILLAGSAAAGLTFNLARFDGQLPRSSPPDTAVAACEVAPTVETISLNEAAGICAGGPDNLILDVRSADRFARGHLPEAIHVPCKQGALGDELEARLEAAPAILVYGDTTEAARPVAESLTPYAVKILEGGYPAWEKQGQACVSGPCDACLGSLDHAAH